MIVSSRVAASRCQPLNAAMYACTGASPSAFAICGLPPERRTTFFFGAPDFATRALFRTVVFAEDAGLRDEARWPADLAFMPRASSASLSRYSTSQPRESALSAQLR